MVYAYEKQDVPLSVPEGDSIKAVGLDMSLPELYLDSNGDTPFYTLNGNTIYFSKAYRKLEKKIGREQRRLSHMEKGSSNYRKQCRKVAKLHAKAKHQRNDFLHQMAVRLAREYDVIGIEDIDLAGMKKALRFGKSGPTTAGETSSGSWRRNAPGMGHCLSAWTGGIRPLRPAVAAGISLRTWNSQTVLMYARYVGISWTVT